MDQPLKFEDYTVAWIAVLPIEAKVAWNIFDHQHGQFETQKGDDYIYLGGDMNGHNIVLATFPAGQNYGVGAAAALVNQVKMRFENIGFALLVGVAAGLPNLSPKPGKKRHDIRLGDVLVCIPGQSSVGIVQYDLGKATEEGFSLNGRHAETPAIVRSAIGNIQLTKNRPFKTDNIFSKYLAALQATLDDDDYACRSQKEDQLFEVVMDEDTPVMEGNKHKQKEVLREDRPESERTQVWYGNIGSGNTLMKKPLLRDSLRDEHDLIGLEMEAAGVMNTLPTGVIRGVCDYGDGLKNKDWQPYAAAVAAVYAKGILYTLKMKVPPAKKSTDVHWLVPFEKNNYFVGRESQLKELTAKLSSEDSCERVAVFGLGGVGKTRVVLEFAFRKRKSSPDCSVFWVPAINLTSFVGGYLKIGEALKIPDITTPDADITGLVKKRLSDESTGHWLLIIDNADDIDVLDRSGDFPLLDYLPNSSKGSIIFTTRNRKAAIDLAAADHIIEVKPMNQSEARELFDTSLSSKDLLGEDTDTINRLLEALTYLPLAIIQATAFMAKNVATTSGYLDLYEGSEEAAISLLSEDFVDKRRYDDPKYTEIKNPVAMTWLISFDQIRKQDKLAAKYLSFMACLFQEDIPRSLLPAGPTKTEEFKAIGTLKAYSFISERKKEKDKEQSFDIHRLVHLETRIWLKKDKSLADWTEKAISSLAAVFPTGEQENRIIWTKYLPHAFHVLDLPHPPEGDKKIEIDLVAKVGWCLQTNGQYGEAEKRYRRELELKEELLGEEDPETLTTMSHLASVLNNFGKYNEAKELHQRALSLREKVSGIEDEDTLTSMSLLASSLSSEGNFIEAEKLNRRVLELREELLGPEHTDTLMSRSKLASNLSSLGNYNEAEQMHRQTLEMREKLLPSEHPDVVMSMSHLASVLKSQGKYNEAEKIHRRTLELDQKEFGPDHPYTLTSMSHLASVLNCQGRYIEAESMHRQVLELRKDKLSLKHHHTLLSMSNLSQVLCNLGRYPEAEKMQREALAGYDEVLAKEHPDTLVGTNNLVSIYLKQGRLKMAEKLAMLAAEKTKRVLGEEHPDSLVSVNNLVLLFLKVGKFNEAEELGMKVLETTKRLLGEEHPHTITSAAQLASTYQNHGRLKEAEEWKGPAAMGKAQKKARDEDDPEISERARKRMRN